MKNVLIVIDNITCRNGTERAVSNLANMLVKSNNYNVSIVSVKIHSGKAAYELDERIKLSYLGIEFNGKFIKHTILYHTVLKKIKEICNIERIDVVIGTESGFNYILPFLPKKIVRIGCEHFGWIKTSIHHKIIRKVLYKYLDAVVLLTHKDYKNYNFLHNAYVIPNSLSFKTDTYASFENRKIIAIGRYSTQKGFDRLIKMSKTLKEKLSDYQIFIYGQGELREEYENMIRENDLDNFVILKEPVIDIQSVYKSSSIYVMTSRFEGLPMVLIEAQSFGIPIVSYDCPEGPDEVIKNGRNGFLIEENNEEKFVESLTELATNRLLWNKMQSESIELNKRFETENILSKWSKLIEDLYEKKI